MRCCARTGTPPDGLSLAAGDVSELSTDGSFRITSAGTSPDRLGGAAARLILSQGLPEEGFTDLVLQAPLIIGDSSAPARKN